MVIVGTGGLGNEILSILIHDKYSEEIVFFDENCNAPNLIHNKYRVIKDEQVLQDYLSHNKNFIVGIGNPRIREKLTNKLKLLGGINSSVICSLAGITSLNTYPEGSIIHPFVGISHDLNMGEGCAIHIHSSIGHAAKIGKYVNIGPGVTIVGPIEIGSYTYIGAKVLILPNIKIGNNVFIKPGSIINKDIPDYTTI